jgi:hypothetical protein
VDRLRSGSRWTTGSRPTADQRKGDEFGPAEQDTCPAQERCLPRLKNQIGLSRLRLPRMKFVREQFVLAAAAQNNWVSVPKRDTTRAHVSW